MSDETHPISASAGGDNAHVLDYCTGIGGTPHYAVCLRRLDLSSKGKEVPCEKYVGGQHCEATAKRKEEQAAGHALYYVPREKVKFANAERDKAAADKWVPGEVGSRTTPRKQRSRPKTETPAMPMSYDDAMAAAISGVAPSEQIVFPTPSDKWGAVTATTLGPVDSPIDLDKEIKEGKSLLEIARAKMRAQA